MSLAFFPLYPDDFEADTAHLSLAEDGAYNRLLRLCWRTPGCSLPADEAWIMRKMRARTDEEKDVVRIVLDEFFTTENGRVFSRRLVEEWSKAKESHEKRVLAGSKGGKAKPLKTNKPPPSNAKAKPKQPEPQPEPYVSVANATATSAQPQPHDGQVSDDQLLDAVMAAVGLRDGRTPTHWMPPASTLHVSRWRSQLGLTAAQIVEAARESRKRHADPPNGPKALDGAMQRLASALRADPLAAGSQQIPGIDQKRQKWRQIAGGTK